MPERTRSSRTVFDIHRAQRVDRVVLPAVVALLVLGATFVVIAWSQAEDTTAVAQARDEQRANRLSDAVVTIIEQQWDELDAWATARPQLLASGREDALAQALAARVSPERADTNIAWAVVRGDGTVAAVGEREPGILERGGIVDDVRALGRRVLARDVAQVTGPLTLLDDRVYAAAVATGQAGERGERVAVVRVERIAGSALSAFLDTAAPGAGRSDTPLDEVALVDLRGRTLVGDASDSSPISRPVGTTGWTVEYGREEVETLVPRWAFPIFAALLVSFALAYVLQDLRRRRLYEQSIRRAREVHALYGIASRLLHAGSADELLELLVQRALTLVDATQAEAHVQLGGHDRQHAAGAGAEPVHAMQVDIEGSEQPLGTLSVSRSTEPFDDQERWLVQTAAVLAGAALQTHASLEVERRAASELQRLDELRSNLLATVAHELLSPLTSVKGVLGLLGMQPDLSAKAMEYVDVATERTDRLVALINDLFDCSLLETGQLDIRPRRQHARDLLESSLGAQAAARPGELVLRAHDDLQITVDPVRFDQLVNNLVTNAFRHGAPPVMVEVLEAPGGVEVRVSDDGPGIAPEARDEVFGKFWQGSRGHARLVEGAGLGLSLVEGLVHVHGGSIRIESVHASGRGARFVVFLPDEVPASAMSDSPAQLPVSADPLELGPAASVSA